MRCPYVVTVPVRHLRLGGEEHRSTEPRQRLLDGREVLPHHRIYRGPVIKARASHPRVVEGESERFHEVELSTGGEAGPAHIPGIEVDLRLDQNHV